MYKKIIFILALVTLGLHADVVNAQAGGPGAACLDVNQGNYMSCCLPPYDDAIDRRCAEYVKKRDADCGGNLQNCNTGIAGQITSGTPTVPSYNAGPGYDGAGSDGRIVAPGSASELTACTAIKFRSFLDILIWLKCIIVAAIIPLIFAIAFVVFLWGVLRFMMATEPAKKEEGKKMIWWGMVSLFVMVSIWGIIKILSTTLGIDSAVPLLKTDYLDTKNASK